MLAEYDVYCSNCGKTYGKGTLLWRCECGSPLDIKIKTYGKFSIEKENYSMWRYKSLLPSIKPENITSLKEGFTPIVERNVAGIKIWYKLDFLNPTGSFKDRGASMLVSYLREQGIREVVEDSSGNAGAALSAYCSVAGIKCKVFVPASAPEGKIKQISSYGAEVIPVEGSREDVNKAALKAARKSYYAGHLWNPFFIEGLKTISFEVYEMTGGRVPDTILVPVGSGGLLIGIYKGFRELKEAGYLDHLPRLIGIQTPRFARVYELLYNKKVRSKSEAILADGIAVPDPPRAHQVARIIEETEGKIILVYNEEIVQGFKELARMGLYVEPTSATVQAAFRKLLSEKFISRGEAVLAPLTGIGLKATDKIIRYMG